MQRRTYPFAFVILSPGSKIGHTPRKNPSASIEAAATSRINAYRGWCRTPVLHQPFAAKKYDTTQYRKLQVFFQQIVKYFLKIPAFCRNSSPRPFPAFPFRGHHLLPWYVIPRSCAKSKGCFTHILPGMVHFLLFWGCWDFCRRSVVFWGGWWFWGRKQFVTESVYILFFLFIYKDSLTGTPLPPNIPPQPNHNQKSQGHVFLHSPDFNLSSLYYIRFTSVQSTHRCNCRTNTARHRSSQCLLPWRR